LANINFFSKKADDLVNINNLNEQIIYKEKCKNISEGKSKLANEYLMLSKSNTCWTKDLVQSVDVNIKLLKNTKKYLESKGVEVKFLLVPAPWAYKNQSTVGRTFEPYYFPEGIAITTAELIKYVVKNGLEIIDLTEYLHEYGEKKDSLYFRVDGHWTEYAHLLIYKYLVKHFHL
jgi:hypothetical protein